MMSLPAKRKKERKIADIDFVILDKLLCRGFEEINEFDVSHLLGLFFTCPSPSCDIKASSLTHPAHPSSPTTSRSSAMQALVGTAGG